MSAHKNITGIILAGGKSSRMGTDKGFVIYKHQTFMAHIIEVLRLTVDNIIIVSDNTDYDSFNLKRVNDVIKDSGPLAGLYSGLIHSTTENNLVLSCDIPLITLEILQKLIEHIDDEADIIQLESKRKPMPLIAMYKKKCAQTCAQLLQNDERRMSALTNSLNTKTVLLEQDLDKYTLNVNTLNELNALKR